MCDHLFKNLSTITTIRHLIAEMNEAGTQLLNVRISPVLVIVWVIKNGGCQIDKHDV